ncbi:hypothetical protein EDO6_00480 [Paenibacillus xylanexedens]|nr:hypothetical protein EDO6_00480 [Paenibacillus xylanexedens]
MLLIHKIQGHMTGTDNRHPSEDMTESGARLGPIIWYAIRYVWSVPQMVR